MSSSLLGFLPFRGTACPLVLFCKVVPFVPNANTQSGANAPPQAKFAIRSDSRVDGLETYVRIKPVQSSIHRGVHPPLVWQPGRWLMPRKHFSDKVFYAGGGLFRPR